MKRRLLVSIASVCILTTRAITFAAEPGPIYPPAARGTTVDTYFGTQVADPYRWLEDLDSPQTRAWVRAQAALTEDYLARIPARRHLHERLTKLWNYEKLSAPSHRGEIYFFFRNAGLQNQSVLYVSTGENGAQRVLLDPNTLSSDGTVALAGIAPSRDGKLLAYAISSSGSDWMTWHVRDVAGGKDLADTLEWAKFSGASWLKDDSGFYYSAYDPPQAADTYRSANYNQKVYFHRLGTPQSADQLVYQRPDHKEWYLSADVSEDGRYLLIYAYQGTDPHNRLYYRDLQVADSPIVPLYDRADASYTFVDNDGSRFFIATDRDAPRGRLVSVDRSAPETMRDVIPQSRSAIESITSVGGRFFARYLTDARSQVRVFDRSGNGARDVELPGIGTVTGFGGFRDDARTYYTFSSFTSPPAVYRYDLQTGRSTLLHRAAVNFDSSQFTTEQVFFCSKDGTRIPMFVSYKKGIPRDGRAPTLLYGYGGFNIPLTPEFSAARALWLEMGGIYAVPNLRGGSEYGEDWHRAGILAHKQNVFDDFIAAAEYLIANRYTSTPKLAIAGGSNGGLLVGAVMTQRPDLFGAALPSVGVLDMLRYEEFTVGHGWIPEYGSARVDAAAFQTLLAYSPLHNIKPGTAYPPTLISTADHDDRVFPAHSFKFAAGLQHAQRGGSPVLIRIETKAGHGAGKPTSKAIDELADEYTFLTKVLDFTP